MVNKRARRQKIRYRIRKRLRGDASTPRLSVFRSNSSIYCQIIDDINGQTIAAASSKEDGIEKAGSRIEQAKKVGALIADRAKTKDIGTVVFDRAGYLYHGRIKSLADGAREGGLNF